MGRKSSEKKKRKSPKVSPKKPIHHKQAKPLEKDIKMPVFKLTDNKQEAEQTEKPKLRIKPHKIFGSLLALIMLTILIVVGSMMYVEAFKPASIAKYLPANKTAAFIELNINREHAQFIKTENLLSETVYSFEKIKGILSDKLSMDLGKTDLLWLGREVGIAEMLFEGQSESLSTVYFVEVSNRDLSNLLLM